MVRTPLSECYGQLVEFRPLRVKSPTVIPYDEGRVNALEACDQEPAPSGLSQPLPLFNELFHKPAPNVGVLFSTAVVVIPA